MNISQILADRPKPKKWKGQHVRWIQEKRDGFRATIIRGSDKFRKVIGRKEHIDLFGKLHPWTRAKIKALPEGTIFDGELCRPGCHGTEVARMLANKDKRLEFHIFAIPMWNGRDSRSYSLEWVKGVAEAKGFWGFETEEFDEHTQEELIYEAKERNVEGFILKGHHYSEWYKVKPVETIDCKVITFIPGNSNSKYSGMLGSLEVALRDETGRWVSIGTVGTGFKDEERLNLSPSDTVGRVVEISFDSVAAQGRLKFARFERWRDDKPSSDCTIDQLPG